jgi:hypothetical protein
MQIPDHTNTCNHDTDLPVGSLVIEEPVAVLTNILLASVCFWVYRRIKRELSGHPVNRLYARFFLVMSAATLLGGIFGHAFCGTLGIAWKLPGWLLSMVAVMFAERASIVHTGRVLPSGLLAFFRWMNIAELLVLVTLTLASLNFFFVEFHAFYGFVGVVGVFESWHLYKTGNK